MAAVPGFMHSVIAAQVGREFAELLKRDWEEFERRFGKEK